MQLYGKCVWIIRRLVSFSMKVKSVVKSRWILNVASRLLYSKVWSTNMQTTSWIQWVPVKRWRELFWNRLVYYIYDGWTVYGVPWFETNLLNEIGVQCEVLKNAFCRCILLSLLYIFFCFWQVDKRLSCVYGITSI